MSLVVTSNRWTSSADIPRSQTFVAHDCKIDIGVAHQALEGEWKELEAEATATMFQSFGFVDTWCRLTASAVGEQPVIATGRRDGVLRFILPLAVVRRAGVRVLTWLAQSHANYGMALMRNDALAALDSVTAAQIVAEIARRVGASAIHLDNQPARWAGLTNPFAAGSQTRLTANDTFVFSFADDFKAQYNKLFSSRTRSSLGRKRRRMGEDGDVAIECPPEPDTKRRLLGWFVTQKREQLAEDGQRSTFDEPAVRALYENFARTSPAFEVDRLAFNGGSVAITLTMRRGGEACLINSAHTGGDFARFSPGTLLLHALMTRLHGEGVRSFDFGPGAVPYKFEWEPDTIPLLATTRALSLPGVPAKTLLVLVVATKRILKRSDRFRPLAFEWRRRWRGLRRERSAA